MSLTLLGWLVAAVSIAISALLILRLRSSDSRRERLAPETSKARVEDAARPALLSRLSSSSWRFGHGLRGAAGKLIVPSVIFLFVAGIGAAASYVKPFVATGSEDTYSFSQSDSGADGEMLASLEDYTRTIAAKDPAATATSGELLPDVGTMIERLAARLKATPEDIDGWRMLGWSYFHTGRYEEAATAYARAVELDPNSAELKLSYEEAKAKASKNSNAETDSSLQSEATGNDGVGPSVEQIASSEEMPARERDAAIRSMVDGLADRLEKSPRDVEGWTRLMRSRVVLGEREVAATAFRKALEVFKDDSAASGKITAAAIELGLKAE